MPCYQEVRYTVGIGERAQWGKMFPYAILCGIGTRVSFQAAGARKFKVAGMPATRTAARALPIKSSTAKSLTRRPHTLGHPHGGSLPAMSDSAAEIRWEGFGVTDS